MTQYFLQAEPLVDMDVDKILEIYTAWANDWICNQLT